MRLPISSAIASLVVALIAPSAPVQAQQNTESTIRLTSAVEPVSSNPSYDTDAQPSQPAQEQRQVAPPIQQPGQSTNPPVHSFAPPIVHTPVEAPSMNRTKMPAGFYASPEAR